MNLFNVFVLLLVVFHANIMNGQSEKGNVRVLLSKDISKNQLIPSDYLEINVSFAEQPPYSKGFWFFKKEKLLVRIKLTNLSDKTYYFPSIFFKNPSFSVKKNKKQVFGKKLDLIHPTITLDFFQKLKPKDSYEQIVNVQEMYEFNFAGGEYTLSSTFYSKYGKLILNGKEFPIWSGTIHSNSLKFYIE